MFVANLPSVVCIGGLDRQALLHALRQQNIELNRAAQDLFADHRFSPSSASTLIEISCWSVAELGLLAGAATYDQLLARALERGLQECPLELGPHLRLQFPDQLTDSDGGSATRGYAPNGSITVASHPLDASDETPKGFYLRRIEGRLCLRGYWSSPDHLWSAGDLLVFSSTTSAV